MKSFTRFTLRQMFLAVFILLFVVSCKKDDQPDSGNGHQQTKTYSSEVAQKWHDIQLRILRIAGTNPYSLNGIRWFAYCGVGLYESVVPGMPAYKSLYGQLTNMPQMPSTENGKAYHWPSSANAALSFLNKNFNVNAPVEYKLAMDSLKNVLDSTFKLEVNQETYQRSVAFGNLVAERIFEWSKSDGALTVYPAYVAPTGTGLWSPTAPNPTSVVAPYWGNNRLFVQGSVTNTSSPAPPPYSTDPNSPYYAMVKEVYDISQTLTQAQRETALYFRDNPGFQAGTHYLSVFGQVTKQVNPSLEFYALAQALTGVALADANIDCFRIKYALAVDRPIKYIREVLGHTTWSPVIPTPGHPDFPSGHSQNGGAFATVLTSLLGPNYEIKLHTYDNLGFAPRTYPSFNEMVMDVGRSRVYAGIHYTYSCTEGRKQGEKIAANIISSLHFKK